jgi:glycosyltransferase involved in cell wall biosynthesis
MKVYFDSVNFESSTGPNSFAKRLAMQLSLMGVEIVDAHDNYDIALVTIEHSSRLDVTKPFVVRLDGIWFKPEEFHTRNTRIRDCYNHADAVVFQSEFDMKMVTKWFGIPRTVERNRIIRNGISLQRVDRIDDAIMRVRDEHEKVFVCSAAWHPQKRLSDNIALYRHIRKTDKNSCLIVLGGGDVKMDRDCVRDHIFYTGPQPQEKCLQVFAAADRMLHMAWLDHCPNSVLESLSQETAVICGDSGGTKEIVGKNGTILPDVEYNFELMDYDNPPKFKIDNDLIVNTSKLKLDLSDVSIEKCACKYFELFENVLQFSK